MRLIDSTRELSALFEKFAKNYASISFATAWATTHSNVYPVLLKYRQKIKYSTVGIHFYQTDPDFIDIFTNDENVRFSLTPNGVFHPKVYVFFLPDTWEILIGSANFTSGGFTKNTELMIHISSSSDDNDVFDNLLRNLQSYWRAGKSATNEIAKRYRRIWMRNQSIRSRISGSYNPTTDSSSKGSTPIDDGLMNWQWKEYYSAIQNDPNHSFEDRLTVLRQVDDYFSHHNHYSDFDLEQQKFTAGISNNISNDFGLFGSMWGAGVYSNRIINRDINISTALDSIPNHGDIILSDYENYISTFKRAFSEGRDGVAGATRLLSMKRPDWFVCMNGKNTANLAFYFNVKKTNWNYERYWFEIVQRIQDCEWWNSPKPNDSANNNERDAWKFRAAFLDALTYTP